MCKILIKMCVLVPPKVAFQHLIKKLSEKIATWGKKKKIHTWYQTKTINETNVEAIPRP